MAQKVSIIGAGLAGLTAAYRLSQKGYDVDVFEARNRVGGRVHSVLVKNFEGGYSVAELGGQNIADGGKARHLLSLARELDLETTEYEIELSFPFYDGKELHDHRTLLKSYLADNQNIRQTFDVLETSAHSLQDVLDRLFEQGSPLKQAFALQLSSYEGSPPHLLCIHHNLGTLKRMVLGEFSYVRQSSPDAAPMIHSITLKGGNALLPLRLKEKMNGKLHLKKVLKEVSTGDKNQIRLSFQDGTITFCDKLILAMPCTVYSDITFDPKVIRTERLQNIKKVQYGNNAKILSPIQTNSLTHSAMMTDKMVAFFNADQKLLNLYFSRESGEHLLKNLLPLFQETLAALKLGFNKAKIGEGLPVIAQDEQLTLYEQPVAHSWHEDMYAKGSYSNFGIALKDQFSKKTTYREIEVKSLFEPIEDRVFFIGEHTTILDEIGTMEAAAESGERIARLF